MRCAFVNSRFGMVVMVYFLFGKLLFVPIPRGVSIFRELSYYLY